MGIQEAVKYISGYCGIGAHEGSAPRNVNGNALPTCRLLKECKCYCHELYNLMFMQSGMPRIAVDTSGYVPEHGSVIMPLLDELARAREASSSSPATGVIVVVSADPELVPTIVVRTRIDTPTGKSHPGELEEAVNKVCADWVIDCPGNICTPVYIAEEVGRAKGINLPSVGAVGAVFDRWMKLGYANCGHKPVRFIAFTEEGKKMGLEAMKERARRTKR